MRAGPFDQEKNMNNVTILDEIFELELRWNNADTGQLLSSHEKQPYIVHGSKIRNLVESFQNGEIERVGPHVVFREGISGDQKKLTELNRLIAESAARNAAWSMGERTKIPFIMHESMHMRVNVDIHGDEKRPAYAANIGAARVDISMRELNFGNLGNAIHSARVGVIMSFMMHDKEMQEKFAAGDKYGAAGLGLAADAFAGHIASDQSDLSLGDLAGFDGKKIQTESGALDLSQFAASRELFAETYINQVVNGTLIKGQRDKFTRFSEIEKTDQEGAFKAEVDENTYECSIKAYAEDFAHLLWLGDQLKDSEDQNGEGEGDGDGAQSAADKVLQQYMGESPGQKGQGEEPGEADAQGEADGEGGDPTEDQRRKAIGRFGSDEKSRRLMEALGVDYQREVVADTPVSWEDVIHGALLRSLGEERVATWARPNRRFIGDNIYLPGFRRKRVRRLAVAIDESGSIDMQKLMKFNAELIRVIDKINPEGVDIFHFSTSVAEESLAQGEIWEAKRVLDGGTNFTAAYKAMNEHIQNGQTYDAVVFFTDMEDSGYRGLKRQVGEQFFPEGTDFYWVVFGSGHPPEFGSVINMDTGEFTEYGHL